MKHNKDGATDACKQFLFGNKRGRSRSRYKKHKKGNKKQKKTHKYNGKPGIILARSRFEGSVLPDGCVEIFQEKIRQANP